MRKETKTMLKIILGVLIVIFGLGYVMIWSSGIDEEYPLSYYGCDNIELAFDYGYCLPTLKHNLDMFARCHSEHSVERYYQLNCMEVKPNSSH